MSVIAPTSASAYGAVASLISNMASSATSDAPEANGSATIGAGTSADPTDTVDLSDRAKQVLARANSEQRAADKLNALLQSLNDPDGKNLDSRSKSTSKSGNDTSVFDKLS